MKLNLANPTTGLQKVVEIDDEKRLLGFFEKRMGAEVPGDTIGDEFKGYTFRISGGNDKQGFPMLQGVLTNYRVRLLFKKGMKCYRPRRSGERKRKSVRGCIVGPDLAVLNLVLVKKGAEEIPGLTDGERPRRLGPKRANHIRKLFGLSKNEDPRAYVVRRQIEGKKKSKAPKIQRLVTPARIQRKKRLQKLKIKRWQESAARLQEYKKLVYKYNKEKKKRALKASKKVIDKKGSKSKKLIPKDKTKKQSKFIKQLKTIPKQHKTKASAPKPKSVKVQPNKVQPTKKSALS